MPGLQITPQVRPNPELTLGQPLQTNTYTWRARQGPLTLPSVATHFCVITKISGKFAGYGERVALAIDSGASGGPRWTLNGTSGQDQLMAEATCAPKALFVPASSSSLMSWDHGAFNQSSCDWAPKFVSAPSRRAYFLSGLAGKFQGDGEVAQVTHQRFNNGGVELRACSGAVEARLMSIGGENAPAKYRTSTSRTTEAQRATFGTGASLPQDDFMTFFVGPAFSSRGASEAFMVPVDEALCGLVMVRGKMQGYGEEATVRQATAPDGRKWWTVYAGTQASGSSIAVAAHCFARDQR